ncbi:type IV secretory system conjugative DNA transfer family protein, partial [Pseudomonas aeruginosa]|uniref:type IV secretory system conjugative DNA transfer family protein n=1 Tax=Pseudomonas aeruginosa TaxID=287 RepID=UPI001266D2F3
GSYGIRSFLIAQSLNQIDKAYGQNHSILDNCHVRVTFATNDERTAKRISETLGTATELRAQRNYAGHRLAPWLGHLMVSRQETARPLLTPGEVMQLPPDESVVMVSSVAPIKAKKLRYYADANFKRRVLPPPALAAGRYADVPPGRPDVWSGLSIPAMPAAPAGLSGDGASTADDGGPRRQPELSEVAEYSPEPQPVGNDLALLDDDDDLPLPLPGQLDPAMQRTARLASLDPNDGIDL